MSEDENDDEDVYNNILSFRDFRELTNQRHYRALPSSWFVIVSDIVGSTAAIEAGKYQQVNTIGVACIAAVKNALIVKGSAREFPYVFGGDGASMVVPPHHCPDVIDALLALRRMVQTNYGLELRVGRVMIRDLEAAGATVQVARYELVACQCIAFFRGGGLALADSIIKSRGSLIDTESSLRMTPELRGLSCRWQRIPNRNGIVVSLLVMANPDHPDDSDDIYQKVLDDIDRVLQLGITHGNPVNLELLRYKTAWQMLREEVKFHQTPFCRPFLSRALEILLCAVIFRLGLFQHSVLDVPEYKSGLRAHADHYKFDDMLRMVIDCSVKGGKHIESMLDEQHNQGIPRLFYGVHYSRHSLMTCLLSDTTEGNHIHFIDGDDGGYAMAAKQLKLQLKKAAAAKMGPECQIDLPNGEKSISIRHASLESSVSMERALEDLGSSDMGSDPYFRPSNRHIGNRKHSDGGDEKKEESIV